MIHKLLKFQSKERVYSLQNEGLLYLNTRTYFRDLEKENSSRNEVGIGDRYEQTYEVENIQPGRIELEYEDGSIEVIESKNTHIITYDLFFFGNVYCMTGLCDGQTIESLDNKLFSFGDYCCIIDNPKEFLSRLAIGMKQNEIEFKSGMVNYYDMFNGNRKMTPFCKPSYLSFQSEFRIFAKSGGKKPLIIKIGDISDISRIVKTDKIKNGP